MFQMIYSKKLEMRISKKLIISCVLSVLACLSEAKGINVLQTYSSSSLVSLTQNSRPSIIPLPQSLEWSAQKFDLNKCESIIIKSSLLREQADRLQKSLLHFGKSVKVIQSRSSRKNAIELNLGSVKVKHQPEEAYHLKVKNTGVTLTANDVHGIFNGLQTLSQLVVDNRWVAGCSITDYPAYKWRGYMVDVGRNYQSPELLKQQIDKMAQYKLNVFHLHLTEHVAWRLQIKAYPQLTAAEHMTRNQGKYYSVGEMKDLIEYCRKRHITLVPEIDMPGHSDAFTRAMGVDMQSEKGTEIMKRIMHEVCTTYDVPYMHIGADEVKITNEKFLPELTKLIRGYKKKVIAWSPGSTHDSLIINHLWGDGEGIKDASQKYIDSEASYISDFDPSNSVVTLFNRQLGGRLHSDSTLLGAEFCVWADRKVRTEFDLVNMNAVFPSILAFSERSWRGGGYPGILMSIGPDTSVRAKDFAEFEKRLLDHKRKYFTQLPFNYVKQTHIKWNLFGPFENNGDLTASYWPEGENVALEDSTAVIQATGGTVWLWPTKWPYIKGWLPSPKQNTTWYAFTRFWSNSDSVINIWLETKDLSKSGADATPPEGEWDYTKSKLWINGKIIPPPKWTFPGRASGKLEEPMVDEGYYYRPPNIIKVKKGWNKVLVKLPVNKFDPTLDWQVPPKLMFTVIPVHRENGINWHADEIEFKPAEE